MPEVPEIEIMKDEMSASLKGRKIERVFVKHNADLSSFIEFDLFESLEGAAIKDLDRRATVLIFHLDNDRSFLVKLYTFTEVTLTKMSNFNENDTQLVLDLDNGGFIWFSGIRVSDSSVTSTENVEQHHFFDELGLDPMDKALTVEELKEKLRASRGKLKNNLMTPWVVAGLGDLYTDEILFDARLHPSLDVSQIRHNEAESLLNSIRTVMGDAMNLGGSSENNWHHLDGSLGKFDEHISVHHRAGQPCYVCTTPIKKVRYNGRFAYICPNCQRFKRR